MYQKAKLKSTGEIVVVYKCAGWSNTEYYQDANNEHKKYVASDLDFDFTPPIRCVLNSMCPATPFNPDELVSCDPIQIVYDDVNHIARIEQVLHIRMTEEVIKNALQMATDQQLKDELKRREKAHRSRFPDNLRCRDCKHCGAGKTYPCTKMAVTVCLAKPKPKAGPDCYYATLLSCKVCEKFESKN